MTIPETQALQLMEEKQWEAAIVEWRRLVETYPEEGKYRKRLGEEWP